MSQIVFHSKGSAPLRLLKVLQQADPSVSAQEMVDWILEDVTAFIVGDMDPPDDITVIVLRYNLATPPPAMRRLEI